MRHDRKTTNHYRNIWDHKQWQDLTDQQTESPPPWVPHNLSGLLLLELNALDMDAMIADVQTWKDAQTSDLLGPTPSDLYNNVLILDGFRMYALRDLEQMINKKYFIRVSFDACKVRRRTRHYTPPDKPGYFEKIVWPESINHQREIQDQDDIEYLDGTANQEELCQRVLCDIQRLCRLSS